MSDPTSTPSMSSARAPAAAHATGGRRGPADHQIRDQIVDAADHHFREFGYEKTTVSELARAIGFSKAYIYKFFDSKQAIGEAICATCLGGIDAAALAASAIPSGAGERLRALIRSTAHGTIALFSEDRRLYDIAAHSAAERWPSFLAHEARLSAAIRAIVVAGRESGEFERKTPVDEVARSILLVIQPLVNPLMLQHSLDVLPDALNEVVNLVLRSLAP